MRDNRSEEDQATSWDEPSSTTTVKKIIHRPNEIGEIYPQCCLTIEKLNHVISLELQNH